MLALTASVHGLLPRGRVPQELGRLLRKGWPVFLRFRAAGFAIPTRANSAQVRAICIFCMMFPPYDDMKPTFPELGSKLKFEKALFP